MRDHCWGAKVRTLVIATDEELMIARDTKEVIREVIGFSGAVSRWGARLHFFVGNAGLAQPGLCHIHKEQVLGLIF